MLRPNNVTPQLTVSRPAQRLLSGLTVGQTVKAQVLQGTPPEQGGGRALLSIGRTTIHVRSQTPLRTGHNLSLQVTALGKTIGLRVLDPVKQQTDIARTDPLLRRLLPQQSESGPLYTAVSASAPPPGARRDIREAWQGLRQALPQAPVITQARGLKQAVEDSGVFLEAKLSSATPSASLGLDLKAAGLRLLATLATNPGNPSEAAKPGPSDAARSASLTPPPPLANSRPVPQSRAELPAEILNPATRLDAVRQLLEGTLARVSLHQLANLSSNQADGAQSWILEVPVRDGDVVDLLHLRITEEEHQRMPGDATERLWSVDLATNLPELGPIRARIQVLGGRVSTVFWAEQEETATRIDRELPRLRASFEARELAVESVSAHHGAPQSSADTMPRSGLVDIDA